MILAHGLKGIFLVYVFVLLPVLNMKHKAPDSICRFVVLWPREYVHVHCISFAESFVCWKQRYLLTLKNCMYLDIWCIQLVCLILCATNHEKWRTE